MKENSHITQQEASVPLFYKLSSLSSQEIWEMVSPSILPEGKLRHKRCLKCKEDRVMERSHKADPGLRRLKAYLGVQGATELSAGYGQGLSG